MAEYALCKIVGDGKSVQTAFRPIISDAGGGDLNFEVAIKTEKGIPVTDACFVTIKEGDTSVLKGDPDIDLLPVKDADAKLPAEDLAEVKAVLSKWGIADSISADDTYSQVLGKIEEEHK